MSRLRWLRWTTAVNLLLFAWNLVGTWSLFFIYGRRPDGVEPASRQVFLALWLLGPIWSLAALAASMMPLKRAWETGVNGALCIAYLARWLVVVVH
jgi:hypothetical protein